MRAFLESGREETIKPGDPRLARCTQRIIASPRMALEAAAQWARAQGLATLILGDDLQGEARELGRAHAELARQVLDAGAAFASTVRTAVRG